MYKKILIMGMIIPFLIVANNLTEEQVNELKDAQEQHYLERENAKSDLKLAALAGFAGPAILLGLGYIMVPLGLSPILKNISDNHPDLFLYANICISSYALTKTIFGIRHLLIPDYPKPEDKAYV
jgi:hypothetical protein